MLISDVNENGPSQAAGIKRGDVVVAFNGKDIQSVSQLRNLVARTMVGKDATIKVLRDGKENSATPTKNNIVVYHRLDSGSNEPPITSSCTFASGIPTNLPCRDVDIKRGGGNVVVTIDVWSAGNGRWGVG